MFEGFAVERIDVGEVVLRVRHGGDGPPVLLLHGHPRTHTTWHAVAPLLAARHTVVCPDLRGYGESTVLPPAPRHEQASKRAMAGDLRALMRALGHERFAVAGHDRGGYAALRLALDHPEAVERLAVLDDVPIGEALARCDARFAIAWWHWFFLGNPSENVERALAADPDAWYGAGPEQRAALGPATTRTGCARSATPRCGGGWSRRTTCTSSTATSSTSGGRGPRTWPAGRSPPATT
jgi:haloacetate dehalogenase